MEEADNNEIEGDVGDMGTQSNAEDTKSEGDSSANELPIEIAVGGEKVSTKANTSEDVQEFWVQIRNLPPSMRQKNIKAFLMR
ncbi:unnamed protein product [Toxocara canis]|uniref:Uncharacterized protein n=1 Tax=Toxocara canis TaxID=6265 RepID=A0A183VG30_TOXCA|nr:unnamed protein product [Toxocara canis]